MLFGPLDLLWLSLIVVVLFAVIVVVIVFICFCLNCHRPGHEWEKLGKDLDREYQEGKLKPGTRPLWRMVRACLEDKRYEEAIKAGQKVLLEHQDSMSEGEKEPRVKEKIKGKKKEKKVKEETNPELRTTLKSPRTEDIRGICPSLKALALGSNDDSELSAEDEVDLEDEADLEEEVATYEREMYDPDWSYANAAWQHGQSNRRKVVPTAPPFNPRHLLKTTKGTSFCPEVWKEMGLSFPVFLDANGHRYHEPVDFKTIKQLAESVRTYGVNAAFVLAQIESLARYCLTPSDWGGLVRACLTSGQYLDWKSYLFEYANAQAAVNLASGVDPQRHWDADMLLGQGRFALDQTTYPEQVYAQINDIAVKAWKALPNRGEVSGNLTKVLQGSTEPFSDFVARMVEAATKIFGDPDTAMPLIKQLVYEQCTKECRVAITPYKHKGLEVWMKVCREIGGPLTNAGLAAAVVQLKKNPASDVCFKCGRKGHYRKQCPEKIRNQNGPRQPGLCPRCKKGNHWASECRSVKDLEGKPLTAGYGGTRPKNGQQGPRPQGPQIYGAMQDNGLGQKIQRSWPSLRHPGDRGEPLRAPQDWTSAPPPDSY